MRLRQVVKRRNGLRRLTRAELSGGVRLRRGDSSCEGHDLSEQSSAAGFDLGEETQAAKSRLKRARLSGGFDLGEDSSGDVKAWLTGINGEKDVDK